MSRRTITTDWSLQQLIGDLRADYREHGYLRLSWSTDHTRSADQNALAHLWYEQISRELGEDSTEGVKAYCKLHFGVPILRADDVEFREAYDTSLRGLPYEVKLKAIRLLPVTSRMGVKQLTRYLDQMQKHYAQLGVVLEAEQKLAPKRRVAA